MPAHKRKPNYNGATTMQELLTAVCDYYGDMEKVIYSSSVTNYHLFSHLHIFL